jgi:glycosyltransferase involved in cell wall biosynthesis
MTLVSIVTPSYNQAEYLEQTIRSVLDRAVPFTAGTTVLQNPELEYLLVDGGSTDGSLDIIQRYTDRLAWWCSERDSGQAEAINKGLLRARGDIVAWLNSDDLYLPGAIANAVAVLEANPDLGMVFGDALTIDPAGRTIKRLIFDDWNLDDLISFRIICQPAVFMRREVLEKAGFLEPSYHFMLDHHLWIRMARLAPIKYIPQLWAAARHHPSAKNVSQAVGFGRETLRLLDWMQTQPDLAGRIANQRNRVLRSYGLALRHDPSYALKHWRRMLFAMACLVGGQRLARWYKQWRR